MENGRTEMPTAAKARIGTPSLVLLAALGAAAALLGGCQQPAEEALPVAGGASPAAAAKLPTVSPAVAASMEARLRQEKRGD